MSYKPLSDKIVELRQDVKMTEKCDVLYNYVSGLNSDGCKNVFINWNESEMEKLYPSLSRFGRIARILSGLNDW